MPSDILVVDDEEDIREIVSGILDDEGHETRTAFDSDSALAAIEERVPRLVFLDIWLQGSRLDGLALLDNIKSRYPDLPVIMISGHGNIDTAVSAIRRGAYDFIEKPFKSDRLVLMVRRGLEASTLELENAVLREQSLSDVSIIGDSPVVNQLRDKIQNLAGSNSRALIVGPLGAGKTTLATAIHGQSDRVHEPFLIHSCAHYDVSRDAMMQKFISAHNGTLVLKSVCSLTPEQQRDLLSLLQNSSYNARIIATATNIEALEKDLYERLNVESIEAPALSLRKQDIKALASYFLDQAALELGVKSPLLSKDVLTILETYVWPGNLSEMRAAMLYALINNDNSSELKATALPQGISGDVIHSENVEVLHQPNSGLSHDMLELPLREARELFEHEYLTSQVERFDGNISKTAQYIGMERSALHRKIKSLQDKNISNASDSKKAVSSKV